MAALLCFLQLRPAGGVRAAAAMPRAVGVAARRRGGRRPFAARRRRGSGRRWAWARRRRRARLRRWRRRRRLIRLRGRLMAAFVGSVRCTNSSAAAAAVLARGGDRLARQEARLPGERWNHLHPWLRTGMRPTYCSRAFKTPAPPRAGPWPGLGTAHGGRPLPAGSWGTSPWSPP